MFGDQRIQLFAGSFFQVKSVYRDTFKRLLVAL